MAYTNFVMAILRVLAGHRGRSMNDRELAWRVSQGEGGNVLLARAARDPGGEAAEQYLAHLAERFAPRLAELAQLRVIDAASDGYMLAAVPPAGPPPDNPAGGGGDGEGRSGLAEVLAHPVLFSYFEEDLDESIDNALQLFD